MPVQIAAKQAKWKKTKGIAEGYMISSCSRPASGGMSADLLGRGLGLLGLHGFCRIRQTQGAKPCGLGENGKSFGLIVAHRLCCVTRARFLGRDPDRSFAGRFVLSRHPFDSDQQKPRGRRPVAGFQTVSFASTSVVKAIGLFRSRFKRREDFLQK